MARVVPSRGTLRHLHRLCAVTDSPTIVTRASTTRSIHRHQHQQSPQHPRRLHTTSPLPQTTTPTSTNTNVPPHQGITPSPPLPDISTFYTLFPGTLPHGPPPASPFSIDLRSLRREFLSLQSRFHPDKYPPSTPTHSKALALSSLINNAYRTLSDSLLRAQYLLSQNYDIDVNSEDNSSYPTDQTTLMEVMNAQECVEEAGSQGEVDTLKEQNRKRIEVTVAKLGEAFETGDKDKATQECVRLKYWRSLQQGLDDWEPGKEVRLIH